MLCCIPFAKKEIQGAKQEGEEEQEQQVKTASGKENERSIWSNYCWRYCILCSCQWNYDLYVKFCRKSGNSLSSTAAFMLTVYNVGCFVGSMAFVVILRKVKGSRQYCWSIVLVVLQQLF